jgi:hypothetical protein
MSLNSHFLNNKSLYGPLKFEYVTSVGNRSFTKSTSLDSHMIQQVATTLAGIIVPMFSIRFCRHVKDQTVTISKTKAQVSWTAVHHMVITYSGRFLRKKMKRSALQWTLRNVLLMTAPLATWSRAVMSFW